jgi:hypothetical protein
MSPDTTLTLPRSKIYLPIYNNDPVAAYNTVVSQLYPTNRWLSQAAYGGILLVGGIKGKGS